MIFHERILKHFSVVKVSVFMGLISWAMLGIGIREANAVSIFYDEASWNSAVVGLLIIDEFDNHISPSDSITFDSGVISTRSSSSIANYVGSNGYYLGQINVGSTLTWTFPWEVTAISFDIMSINDGTTVSSNFDGTGDISINPATDNNTNIYSGFVGIIGNSGFNSIIFSGSLVDAFTIDNLSFSNVSEPIPEPTTMILFGVGLIGLAGVTRRKLKK